MFELTKNLISTVNGKVCKIDDLVNTSVKSVTTKLTTLKEKAPADMVTLTLAKEVLTNLELKNVDSKIVTIYNGTKVRTKKWYQTFTHYGYLVAGDVLSELGESTADDDIIIAIVTSACVAAVASMGGPVGGILANIVTANTLKPILKGAFKLINKYEISLGKNLKGKA